MKDKTLTGHAHCVGTSRAQSNTNVNVFFYALCQSCCRCASLQSLPPQKGANLATQGDVTTGGS